MGGGQAALSNAEAGSVLGWWLESGVDTLVQESPRDWLAEPAAPAPSTPAAVAAEPPPARPRLETLDLFRDWLAKDPAAPAFARGARPVLPHGAAGAELMVLADPPGRDEAADGRPIGGEAWALAQRMLAAIGIAQENAYFANLTCFHSPGARLSPQQLADCGDAARRHIALVGPKRLLLLGDGPARALLGKAVIDARGHVHQVEGIRAVATFHPRLLLKQPSEKARTWNDLLLLMEESA